MDVCVIGTGNMGRRHIEACQGLGYAVKGIHDPYPDAMKLAVTNNKINPDQCYDSVEAMLASVRPRAVVISSTAPSHAAHTIAAAKAGAQYILCEKPMASSLGECDAMMEACERAGAKLAINHQMRFMDRCTKVKELAESEAFGGLESINVVAGNFGLAMNASHYFEIFRYLMGEDVVLVNFWADAEKCPNPRGAQYADVSGQLRALTASGKRLHMELGGGQGHGLFVTYGCRYGQIFVDVLAGHLHATVRKAEHRQEPTTRYAMPSETISQRIAPADVIVPTQALWKALVTGGDFPDGKCGKNALACLVAAHVSAENKGSSIKVMGLDPQRSFNWA